MTSGLNKLFWGTVLISIHLNIGSFKIFPPFIGWIVILLGILKLEKNENFRLTSGVKTSVWILIVLTLLEEIFALNSTDSIETFLLLLFYPTFIITIELIFFHLLFERIVNYFNEIDAQDNVPTYIRKDRRYIILMGITLFLLILSRSIDHGLIVFVGSIMMIVARIYVLKVIHSLRKEQRELVHIANSRTFAKKSL